MNREEIIKNIKTLHPTFDILGYTGCGHVLVNTAYGICKVQPNSLLSGSRPTISTAINKTEYFTKQIAEIQPDLKVLSKYMGALNIILVQNNYGVCKSTPNRLLHNQIPGIGTACDKTKYFINQAVEIHNERYDYSNSIYTNSASKVIIICKEHGEFEQLPNNHLVSNGCIKCGNVNKKGGNFYTNKLNFDRIGTLYILKFENEYETFYKFGVSVNLEKRINNIKNECKNIYTITVVKKVTNTVKHCFDLEQRFKKRIWKYRRTYIPKVIFGGMYECFK